jgi:ribosomal protein S18 acetylase RimI-like enzyme
MALHKGKTFTIRAPRLPEEEQTLASFIAGLQVFEHAFEPNRRTDAAVGADYYRVLMKRVAESDGRVFVADEKGRLLGWLVSLAQEGEVYVLEEERRTGYIAELFVVEEVRGAGVGRALIAAAEADFRARGFPVMTIGAVAGNTRARAIYESLGYRPYATILRKKL